MSARGTITFNITDYKAFIKLHRLINFDLETFKAQIKDAVTKYIKGVVTNIPSDHGIPVLQIERKILQINDIIGESLKTRLENDFGVNVKGFDLSAIEPDKESEGYLSLLKVTKEQAAKTTIAQTDIGIKNLADTQRINAENMEATLRIQREEAQRAQKLQTESNFMGAHALNQQTAVLQTAAEGLGQMGQMNLGGGGGMNPAGMMTGMMMGGAMGQQMAGMMNQMGNNVQQSMNTPPPMPQVQYNVNINGQNYGPYGMQQLQQMVQNGQLTRETYVWKSGMANWEFAGNVAELACLFGAVPPPMPPVPPVPPTL
jgi:membrane protease subunit (stomatin/prohibitin family)